MPYSLVIIGSTFVPRPVDIPLIGDGGVAVVHVQFGVD